MKTNPQHSDNRLVIKPDDVFLVSYPRSGNSWMRYMLANLLHPGLEWNLVNLNRAVPDLHQPIPGDYIGSQPRIFKSHLPYCEDYPRVIYLYRDGRDVAASYYDLKRKVRGYKKEFAHFLLEMLEGKSTFGSWQHHVGSWLFNPSGVPLFLLRYERLCEDVTGTMQAVGDFLGLRWPREDIETAAARSTLEKQQKDFYTFKHNTHWQKGFRGGVKGAPGKWRDVFDKDLNRLFLQYAGDTLNKLEYARY